MKPIDWIYVGLALVAVVLLFGVKLEFKPFKITFEHWRLGVAWVLLLLSLSFFELHYKKEARDKGYKEALQDLKKTIERLEAEEAQKKEAAKTQTNL